MKKPMKFREPGIEETLVQEYLDDNPGILFMEVSVGRVPGRNRRIDGILIPGKEKEICRWGEYSKAQLRKDIAGKKIHVIEAKRQLNRASIGQVEVGKFLMQRDFDVKGIVPVIVCGKGQKDLEEYCETKGIKVAIY